MATSKIRGVQLEDNVQLPGNGGMLVPSGTSAQRYSTPTDGFFRINKDLDVAEFYLNGAWNQIGGSGSINSNSPVVQARRTTTYTMTTTATDLTLDTVDVANNTPIIYRDATNTARIYVTQSGVYELSAVVSVTDTANSSTITNSIRFALNGGAAIVGTTSTVNVRNANAGSRFPLVIHSVATLSAGDYVTVQGLKSATGGAGVLQADLTVTVIKLEGVQGPAGPSAGIALLQYGSTSFDNPNTADWAVNALAPASADAVNSALSIRAFDDTLEEGIGLTVYIPPSATNLVLQFNYRAATAPATAKVVICKLYSRLIAISAAVGAWTTGYQLNNVAIPTNAYFQSFTQTFTLTSLGLTAGNTYQLEITRVGANVSDTLVGDMNLLNATLSFT